jgi:hypothetical protein
MVFARNYFKTFAENAFIKQLQNNLKVIKTEEESIILCSNIILCNDAYRSLGH